jgi:DNA-binding NtrC family response regulator
MTERLKGKRILIVDDEPDVLEALGELLDMCEIDYGVKGYDLLELAKDKDLPALMLTAHAFSSDHLVKSIIGGAYSYIPKAEMVNIAIFLDDAIKAKFKDDRKSQIWFRKLKPIFDKKFGLDWLTKYKKDYKKILKNIDLTHSGEELDKKF